MFVNKKTLWKRRRTKSFVVAPASASTWVVAFARQVIPGALFKTRTAAVGYAGMLASAAGITRNHIKVLGDA
jgi:hypothetical protein